MLWTSLKAELTSTDWPEIDQLEIRVEELNAEFRALCDLIVELVDDTAEALQTQKEIFDAHDEKVARTSTVLWFT